jgi:hypothetical protein
MRRMLIGSLLVGAAIAAIPVGTAVAAQAPSPAPGPGLPVCLTANVGGFDLNQLCKEKSPS